MPDPTTLRESIRTSLAAFAATPLREASLGFFKTLGYTSQRTVIVPKSAPRAFLDLFAKSAPFDQAKALFADWLAADLLFQLTDQELSREVALFPETGVSASQLRSYIFFAIELKDREYPRGKLAGLARQLNRLFPTPVMVLIKHRDLVSLAVINRRPNKLDAQKDVLGRVTLIRDIVLTSPHRGHLDILVSLTTSQLAHPQKKPIADFDTLHAAWEQILNIELLNERFYRELSNWYFWALPQVEFPDDLAPDALFSNQEERKKNADKRRATGLIRLLTRLIFCWFLKEKGLIPEKLFHSTDLAKILKGFDPESETSSTYYQGILQNLFFATLNQRMGKDAKGQPYRVFATDEGFQKNRATHGADNLYRYESLFTIPPDDIIAQFADIPFLNGGLFERLDPIDDDGKQRYLDGFSRNPKKRPHIPDRLFFDSGETADLSTAYGDTKRKAERVTGLITILNRYKFTIVENTPIDQEIALDPELLGKVFENLLASYVPETGETARKQTGSFYTPRPIVDYMVDESLKAHLSRILVEKASMMVPDAGAGLDLLFAYTERAHAFTPTEVSTLIAAIDALKILDPACGSGAFPMGVLHKLVYILGKLDPDNERWKQTQLAKLDSAPMREDLERAFADNNDDYGRKLYLIENCLYGVDIQPIAIQITKLRFFISLVCDQKTNRNKKENHGIRPLPNLETKFVAADTLIGLPISDKDLFIESLIAPIEKEIEEAYHSHFTIQRRDQKFALQKKIKALRLKLTDTLSSSLGTVNSAKAKHLAEWDPFDPQSRADFFDPHWMFGRSVADGFDVVVGNPPYQSAIDHKKIWGEEYRNKIKERYKSARGTWDLHIPFIEASVSFTGNDGIVSLITPNKFLSASYAEALRSYLPKASCITRLADVSHLRVFESASVYPVITQLQTPARSQPYSIRLTLPQTRESDFERDQYYETEQPSTYLTLLPDNLWGFLLSPNIKVLISVMEDCIPLAEVACVTATTTAAEADEIGAVVSESGDGWRTVNTGTIDPYVSLWGKFSFRHQGREFRHPVVPLSSKTVSANRRELFSNPKLVFAKMALRFEGFVDSTGGYAALNCNCIFKPTHGWTLFGIAAILHSNVMAFVYKQYFDGLRMGGGYLPFQAPQLRSVPIPNTNDLGKATLDKLGRLRTDIAQCDSPSAIAFLDDLIDACVMECYLRSHMAERDLLFHDTLAPHLVADAPEATSTQRQDFLNRLHATLNAASHPIRNRLLRLTADSPDLLAVIKHEGRV